MAYWPRFLSVQGLAILLVTFLSTLLEQWLSSNLDQVLNQGGEIPWSLAIVLVMAGLAVSLLSALLVFVMAVSVLSEVLIVNFWPSQFVSYIKESLRVGGHILMGLIFFIIPGLYLILTYAFVGYLVLLDPEYPSGQVNALKKSSEIFRQNKLTVFLATFLFVFVPTIVSSSFDEHAYFSYHPISATAICLGSLFFEILFINSIYVVYKKSGGVK